MQMGFRRRFLAVAAAALLFVPIGGRHALADSPAETAIANLVAAIDAAPGWTASYRHLAYDAASDTAVLSGLAIATAKGEIKIDFETVSVAGYAASSDGGFTAKSIKADGGALESGIVKVALGDVVFDDIGVPAVAGGSYDPEKPFTSIMKVYSGMLKAKLGHGHIGSLSLIEIIEGVTSKISYQDFEISDVHDGKTASITAGPIKMQSPSPDGLVDMSVASVEARDMDLGALIRVYDPAQYASDGTGDMVWHQTLGHAGYKDFEVVAPGAKVSFGEFSMDDFKVRQPKHSFAPLIDTLLAHPNLSQEAMAAAARESVVDLMSAFSIGHFGMSGVKVEATGVSQFEIADAHIADLSIEGLGEFAIEGLAVAIEGQGAVKLDRFAFGGMKFADPEVWRAVMRASASGTDNGPPPVDPAQFVPKLGFLETLGLDVDLQSPMVAHMALGKLRVDLGNYVGYLPTKVDASMNGLDIPVDAMDAQSRETFQRLGYDHVNLDYGMKFAWDEGKEELAVDDFHVRAADIGGISGSGLFGGLPRALFEHPDNPALAQNLSLVSGKLTFSDESIVGKGLGLLAEKMKAPPDKFRQQFADAMPFLLSLTALNDPTTMTILRESGLLKQLTPAVKTFVAEPFGSLTVTMSPSAPVGLAALTEAANKAPQSLIGLLNLSISAEPGKSPAPGSPAGDKPGTELRPTIAPAQ